MVHPDFTEFPMGITKLGLRALAITNTHMSLDLQAMADQWKSHPDFPAAARAVRAVHDADTTAER